MTDPMEFHVINKENRYVVFHPESMSLFTVTEDVGEVLRLYEQSPDVHKISKSLDVSEENIYKIVTSLSEKFQGKASKNPNHKNDKPISLCLIISQDCNLRCKYCYADAGEYRKTRMLMDFDTAKKSIEKLFDDVYNKKHFILFFGGEPFLNFPLMKEIEAYRNKNGMNIEYTASTNGTILNDEIEKFLNDNFFGITVSLDGMKEVNDIQRCGVGYSVHDRVVKNIRQINKSRKYGVAIKSVITGYNCNKIREIMEHNRLLGANAAEFAPVSFISPGSEFYMSDREYEVFLNDLSYILKQNLELLTTDNKITLYSSVFAILRQLITGIRKIHQCSAGTGYIAVSADGDVYPCHGCISMDEFWMGNVHDVNFPGERYYKIRERFINNTVYSSKECKDCWARFLCGGDCYIHSYIYEKDGSTPSKRHCLMMKSIIETLLVEIADLFQDEEKRQKLLERFKHVKYAFKLPNGTP